jgi:hypothetical protein
MWRTAGDEVGESEAEDLVRGHAMLCNSHIIVLGVATRGDIVDVLSYFERFCRTNVVLRSPIPRAEESVWAVGAPTGVGGRSTWGRGVAVVRCSESRRWT